MKHSILVLVGHYLPGYRMGGPLRSIINLIECLSNEFEFNIVTSDRDLGDKEAFSDNPTNCWVEIGKEKVFYLPPEEQNVCGIARIIRNTSHDILYLNSFFSVPFTIYPLLARRLRMIDCGPVIVAPRGEFSAGALAFKNLKKRIYIAVGKATGLFTNIVWHASSLREAADIRAVLGKTANISVAPNLSVASDQGKSCRVAKQSTSLQVVFVARISPMKNLDYALQVLELVKRPVSFSIYGPTEDAAYMAKCQRLAKRLPPHVDVHWNGAIPPNQVSVIMAAHDLLFLPTRGENFGHVIAEALGAGTPVLLSDTTPWRGLKEAGVGWDLPLADKSAFAAAIDVAAEQNAEAAARQREIVSHFFTLWKEKSENIDANRSLFRRSLTARRESGV
jgi:glycosyltransferase involved in cell wall biosynthesis